MSGKLAQALKYYYLAFVLTGLIAIGTVVFSGPSSLLPLIALMVIEITFSFENAVINSQVLAGMSRVWQTVFLTVGIAVAVFGVRLAMPLVLVSGTTGHSVGQVINLAFNNPEQYAHELDAAYPVIAAFGGVFLLMIGLRFFGEKKNVLWLDSVEAPLAEFNQPWWVTLAGASGAAAVIYLFLAPGNERVLVAALLGAVTFVGIKIISSLLLRRQHRHGRGQPLAHGWAGLSQFMYLELLDASFSFDGVIASFAITKKVLLIAAGLGIGAIYVRSITVHLLHRGTLTHYRYLIHGAHYAITALAVLLLASIRLDIPEVVSGFLGLIIIAASFESSRRENHRAAAA
jgi:hypothetical protein